MRELDKDMIPYKLTVKGSDYEYEVIVSCTDFAVKLQMEIGSDIVHERDYRKNMISEFDHYVSIFMKECSDKAELIMTGKSLLEKKLLTYGFRNW